MILYGIAKYLITMAIIGVEESDDNKTLAYVKEYEKHECGWLIFSIVTT